MRIAVAHFACTAVLFLATAGCATSIENGRGEPLDASGTGVTPAKTSSETAVVFRSAALFDSGPGGHEVVAVLATQSTNSTLASAFLAKTESHEEAPAPEPEPEPEPGPVTEPEPGPVTEPEPEPEAEFDGESGETLDEETLDEESGADDEVLPGDETDDDSNTSVEEQVDDLLNSLDDGDALSFEDLLDAGLDLDDLPPDTPVELRTDEDGNPVVITAEEAAQLEAFDDLSSLIEAALEDPGALIGSLQLVGKDMSEEEREESQAVVVSSVIVANIANLASSAATTAAAGAAATTHRRKP